jgi:hypothetical protein
MGMIGGYWRMTPDELERAIDDRQWALDHLEEVSESTYPGPGVAGTDRYMDVDKAWDGIAFLLNAAGGAPVDIVGGGTPVSDEDLGYGPVRYLAPGEVAQASRYLEAMPWERLAGHFEPARMDAAGVYPSMWNDDEAADYLRQNYQQLVSFIRFAAAAGDAGILWLC